MNEKRADKRVWVTVKNVPDYVEANCFIVARALNGELWFYGAYPTKEKTEGVVEKLADLGEDNAIIIH